MSHRPGSTVIPSVGMISAPEGTARVPTWPTAAILSPSMRITLFWIGGPPKPSINVPPTSAFGRTADGRTGCAESDTLSASDAAKTPRTAFMRRRLLDLALRRLDAGLPALPAQAADSGDDRSDDRRDRRDAQGDHDD